MATADQRGATGRHRARGRPHRRGPDHRPRPLGRQHRRRGLARHPPGRGPRPRRRVGLGQDDRGDQPARPPAPRREDRRRARHDRRPRYPRALRRRTARRARRPHQLRAAGLLGLAQSGPAHPHPAHGDPRGARLRRLVGRPRGAPRRDDGRGAAAPLPRFLRRYPHQLSGGQQQRVAIAMAFANRPKVIVLDEPTTALDVTTQAHVLDTVRDLTRRYGVAALYVTHDLAVVANLADRIAVMYAGQGGRDRHPRRALRARPAPLHAQAA